jgi:hypothetical protein
MASSMKKSMWSNLLVLRMLHTLTVSIGCTRLCMDSSKLLGHGMGDSEIFLIEAGFKIGRVDNTLFSKITKSFSFVKFMLMILSLALLTSKCASNLVIS